MRCTIRKISIFGKDGSHRSVDLHPGFNIVTGHSKKGKSALIEIVDYCLCSSRSTIPKGIISDYASMFGLVLKASNTYIVIGRPAWGSGNELGIHVEYEDESFDVDSLGAGYFLDKTLHKVKGAGQELIEKHLGLNVSNTQLPDSNARARKASIRNMTPFLFQYQNLIASKHALFTKLEDYYKRKDIIDQIPIFLGIVNDEYYSLRRQIDELEQKLKKIEREKEKDKSFYDEYQRRLEGLYRNYFSVVGVPFPQFKGIQELVSIRNNLPELDENEYLKTDSVRRYSALKKTQSELEFSLVEINDEISNIRETQSYARNIVASLNVDKDKNQSILTVEHNCPVCGSDVKELSEQAIEIKSALGNLDLEINSMVNFARYDSEQLETLLINKRSIQDELRRTDEELRVLQKFQDRVLEYKNKRDSVVYLKAEIEVIADQVARKVNVSDYGDSGLRDELRGLREDISKYNFEKDIADAEKSLSECMSRICNMLDFEDEFRPANLHMRLDELFLYHKDTKHGLVSLSDMGSGANWLAFHLSASIGMLQLFSSFKSAVVPAFVFLDQPSQVYFPDTYNKDNIDRKNVENIYRAIIRELHAIKANSESEAQVIVLDHAGGLDLGEFNYDEYVRKDWHGTGTGLI